ncbi:DUF6165 family protein [bacterium]|nr:DUF6165 family protein [bacterium]
MKVEVSNGELLDKLSILELKKIKIKDKDKLENIQNEINVLTPFAGDLFIEYGEDLKELYYKLSDINHQLWNIEDWIRDCEREKRFGKEFIELARSVYKTNDKRSEVKKEINLFTNSDLIEEKGYQKY